MGHTSGPETIASFRTVGFFVPVSPLLEDFDAFFGAMLDCVVPNFLASNVSSALLPATIVIEH
jgi:hypothetical protein